MVLLVISSYVFNSNYKKEKLNKINLQKIVNNYNNKTKKN